MKPSFDCPGATSSAIVDRFFFGIKTIGDWGLLSNSTGASSAATDFIIDSILKAIKAKGFAGRRLRARSLATALGLVASQARWKPPKPLTASILPSTRSCLAFWMASSFSETISPGAISNQICGPHTGQATGWA